MMTNREDQANRKNFALPLHALAMLVLILVLGSQRAVVAQQWTTNGNNINNTNTGNVGVGTSNPQATLQVSTSSTAVPRGIINEQTSTDNNSALMVFRKSRAGGA